MSKFRLTQDDLNPFFLMKDLNLDHDPTFNKRLNQEVSKGNIE